MTEKPKPFTHTAYILKREGKRQKLGRWLECGSARIEKDNSVSLFLDRLPVGGFSGNVIMTPLGTVPLPFPERPGDDDGDADEHGEG